MLGVARDTTVDAVRARLVGCNVLSATHRYRAVVQGIVVGGHFAVGTLLCVLRPAGMCVEVVFKL